MMDIFTYILLRDAAVTIMQTWWIFQISLVNNAISLSIHIDSIYLRFSLLFNPALASISVFFFSFSFSPALLIHRLPAFVAWHPTVILSFSPDEMWHKLGEIGFLCVQLVWCQSIFPSLGEKTIIIVVVPITVWCTCTLCIRKTSELAQFVMGPV